jgi:hypothetical protein
LDASTFIWTISNSPAFAHSTFVSAAFYQLNPITTLSIAVDLKPLIIPGFSLRLLMLSFGGFEFGILQRCNGLRSPDP